jgi:hypothetical protein
MSAIYGTPTCKRLTFTTGNIGDYEPERVPDERVPGMILHVAQIPGKRCWKLTGT